MRDFGKLSETNEGESQSIALHSEVRWYGDDGSKGLERLPYRSDIVIMDVSSLRTSDGVIRLPSKGFYFNRFSTIIEIKLRRVNGPTNKTFEYRIGEDRNKIRKIRERLLQIWQDFDTYLLVFDKKGNLNMNQREFGQDQEYYVFSDPRATGGRVPDVGCPESNKIVIH